MKTLFQVKRFAKAMLSQLDDIRDAMHLEYHRMFREHTVMPRLYELRNDPKYAYTFKCLGVESDAHPNDQPIFRIASMEDILDIATSRIINKYIEDQKLLNNLKSKYEMEGQLIEAFDMVNEKVIMFTKGELSASLDIIKNLAATAYFNSISNNPYAYHDRIVWARKLLEPIDCFQIAMLGQYGRAYNDPTNVVESEIVSAVLTFSEIINSEYFTMVGCENLKLTRKATPHGTDVYLSFEFPNRVSYGCFTAVYVKKRNGKTLRVNAIELNEMKGMDSDILNAFKGAHETAKDEHIAEKRASGTIINFKDSGTVSRSISNLLPDTHLEVTYLPLFLAALLDMVSWDWLNTADAYPTMNDAEFDALTENIVQFRKIAPATATRQDDIALVRKFIMLDSTCELKADSLSEEEIRIASFVQDYLDDAELVMKSRLSMHEVPVINCVLDSNFDVSALTALELPISVRKFQLGVITRPGIEKQLETLTGVLYTASTWALISTSFEPLKMMTFPKSSMWVQDGMYEESGFLSLGDPEKFNTLVTNAFGHSELTPCKLEHNIKYVPDLHLSAQLLTTIHNLSSIYNTILSKTSREIIRWELLSRLIDCGEIIYKKCGRPRVTIGTEDDCVVSMRAMCYMYSLWFIDTIFFNCDYGAASRSCKVLADITIEDVKRTIASSRSGN